MDQRGRYGVPVLSSAVLLSRIYGIMYARSGIDIEARPYPRGNEKNILSLEGFLQVG